MDTSPPQEKSHSSNIDNHMNHFMVKAAHDLANFLAQPPQNFTPAANDQGAIQMDMGEDDKGKGENGSETVTLTSQEEHTKSDEESVPAEQTKGNDKEEEGHVEGSQVDSGLQESDSNNEDESASGQPSKETEGSIPSSDSQDPENIPKGTYVVKTDDKGNVSTSMSWSWSASK